MAHRSTRPDATDSPPDQNEHIGRTESKDTRSTNESIEPDPKPETEDPEQAINRSSSIESLNAMTDMGLFAAGSGPIAKDLERMPSRGLSLLNRLSQEQASRRAAEADLERRVIAITMRMIQQARDEVAATLESTDRNDDEDTNENHSPSAIESEEGPDEQGSSTEGNK